MREIYLNKKKGLYINSVKKIDLVSITNHIKKVNRESVKDFVQKIKSIIVYMSELQFINFFRDYIKVLNLGIPYDWASN